MARAMASRSYRATTCSRPRTSSVTRRAFAPRAATPYYGYGYQFWTYPAESRRFALLGVFGQSIFVDPQLRLALIITAAQRDPVSIGDGYGAERNALWRSIVERHGGALVTSAILRAARGQGTARGKTASVGGPWNRAAISVELPVGGQVRDVGLEQRSGIGLAGVQAHPEAVAVVVREFAALAIGGRDVADPLGEFLPDAVFAHPLDRNGAARLSRN